MMQSDIASWSVAILLSLLLHGLMFMRSGAEIGSVDATVLQAPLITRLNFSRPVDARLPDQPQPLPEKPLPKPVEKIQVKRAPAQQQAKRIESVANIEPVSQTVSQPQQRGEQVMQSSDGLLKKQRQLYLHELLSHIETHKYYPQVARRRLIEGYVKISFVLRDDGYYGQLELDGDRSILVQATRQALESARPLPLPPKESGLSRQIEFTMLYSLAD